MIAYLLLRGIRKDTTVSDPAVRILLAAVLVLAGVCILLQFRDLRRSAAKPETGAEVPEAGTEVTAEAEVPEAEAPEAGTEVTAEGTEGPAGGAKVALQTLWDIAELFGRHALLLIAVSLLDGKLSALYARYDKQPFLQACHRLLVDLAAAEGILLAIGRLIPLPGARMDLQVFEKNRRFRAAVFYTAFGIVFCSRFLQTTTFSPMIDSAHPFRVAYRLGVSVCLVIAAVETGRQKSHLLFLLHAAVLLIGIFHYRQGGMRYIIYAMFVLIVAASGKNFRIILMISIIEGVLITITAFAAAKAGLIYYQIRRHDSVGVYRYGLGSISPTDFAAHMLYMCISWCMLRNFTRKWKYYLDYLIFIACFLISWFVNVARTSSVLFLLLIAGTFIRQTFFANTGRSGNGLSCPGGEAGGGSTPVTGAGQRICAGISYVASCSFVVFFFYIVLQLPKKLREVYIPGQAILGKVFDLESIRQRFLHGIRAYKRHGVNFLGSVIKEKGNGLRGDTPKRYTFLDMSYARVLLVGGIAVTVVLIGGMTVLMIRYTRKRMYYIVFLLTLVALNCLVEHHLIEFFYNLFPLMFFANYEEYRPPVESG